jgi:hypothetical protein
MRDQNFGSHELPVREGVTKTSSNKSFGLVLPASFTLELFFRHHER